MSVKVAPEDPRIYPGKVATAFNWLLPFAQIGFGVALGAVSVGGSPTTTAVVETADVQMPKVAVNE
jgi:hypothetical protein